LYENYWGLSEKPFKNTVNPKFFYYSSEHEEALTRILYTVGESKGIMVLTGEIGCGKTFISHLLSRELEEKGYRVPVIKNPILEPMEMLQEILYQLDLDYNIDRKIELIHLLHDFLLENIRTSSETILIIDEAQMIRDPLVFDELRLLLNLQEEDKFLITILMVGQPDLWRVMKKSPAFLQRIGVAFRMKSLSIEETHTYITHRLKVAGADRDIFTPEAGEIVYRYSRGLPREINNICDMALLLGGGAKLSEISPGEIYEAVKELRGAESVDDIKSEIPLEI